MLVWIQKWTPKYQVIYYFLFQFVLFDYEKSHKLIGINYYFEYRTLNKHEAAVYPRFKLWKNDLRPVHFWCHR